MKAVVMETRKNEAAVLLKDGTFRNIKGKYSVGEIIDIPERKHFFQPKRIAAAAAVILMVSTGGGFWYDRNYVAYAEISMDADSSIVYTVNKRGQVLEIKAVNETASDVVNTLNNAGIRFMPISEAIEKTITVFAEEGALDTENDDYILMNVSSDNGNLQEKLTSEIENGMVHAMEKDPSLEYRIDHSDRATAKRARDNHMSIGRYAVWEREGGEREPAEFAEMPVREMLGKPDDPASAPSKDNPVQETDGNISADPVESLSDQSRTDSPDPQPSDIQAPKTHTDSSVTTDPRTDTSGQMQLTTPPANSAMEVPPSSPVIPNDSSYLSVQSSPDTVGPSFPDFPSGDTDFSPEHSSPEQSSTSSFRREQGDGMITENHDDAPNAQENPPAR